MFKKAILEEYEKTEYRVHRQSNQSRNKNGQSYQFYGADSIW